MIKTAKERLLEIYAMEPVINFIEKAMEGYSKITDREDMIKDGVEYQAKIPIPVIINIVNGQGNMSDNLVFRRVRYILYLYRDSGYTVSFSTFWNEDSELVIQW